MGEIEITDPDLGTMPMGWGLSASEYIECYGVCRSECVGQPSGQRLSCFRILRAGWVHRNKFGDKAVELRQYWSRIRGVHWAHRAIFGDQAIGQRSACWAEGATANNKIIEANNKRWQVPPWQGKRSYEKQKRCAKHVAFWMPKFLA